MVHLKAISDPVYRSPTVILYNSHFLFVAKMKVARSMLMLYYSLCTCYQKKLNPLKYIPTYSWIAKNLKHVEPLMNFIKLVFWCKLKILRKTKVNVKVNGFKKLSIQSHEKLTKLLIYFDFFIKSWYSDFVSLQIV